MQRQRAHSQRTHRKWFLALLILVTASTWSSIGIRGVGIQTMAVAAPPATASTLPAETKANEAPPVRLAVLIVVDQFRADRLPRYERWFGKDGFKRLIKEGAYFPNAYYSYAVTSTAVGHATLSTGRLPRQHGIVNNAWFVDDNPRPQAAEFDSDARAVGLSGNEKANGNSPRYLLGSTIGDQLKLADRRSRVFSLALKSRPAVMLGGQKPDGAYWWDHATNKFITSTWYAEQLPAYIAEYNANQAAAKPIGQTWECILPEAAYEGCRPVDPKLIGNDYGMGKAFPHRITNADALYTSPFGNDITLDVAKLIIANEKLGQGPVTDLFCVSFSSNDAVGHAFGPSSCEAMDMTVRTDRQIADLLTFLDKQVGLDRCMIVLAGDHGVQEIPEITEQQRLGGQYLNTKAIIAGLNEVLAREIGQLPDGKSYVLGIEMPWLYFDSAFAEWTSDKQTDAMLAAAGYLSEVPGVAAVYTAAELEDFPPLPDDTARWLAWRSYCPGRSGQVYIAMEPFWYQANSGTTGHGSDQTANRHVPIVLMGPGIAHGRFMRMVDPMDIAPTMAAMLGIEPPNGFAGQVLPEAFEK